MNTDELRSEIAKILRVTPQSLDDTSSPKNVASWDSVAALEIVAFLDNKCGGEISAEEAGSLNSFGAILQVARLRKVIVD